MSLHVALAIAALFGVCAVVPSAASVATSFDDMFVLPVPYHGQITDYCCGDACAQMVLQYLSGTEFDQRAIMNVARTSYDIGTGSADLARVAQFSTMSSAATNNFTSAYLTHGFPDKPFGYGGFVYSQSTPWLDELCQLILQGFPIIVLQQYALDDDEGHYRVVTGCNSTHFLTNDPWNRDGQPQQLLISRADFAVLWNTTDGFLKRSPQTASAYAQWRHDNPRVHAQVPQPTLPFVGVAMIPWNVIAFVNVIGESQTDGALNVSLTAVYTYPCVSPFPCSDAPAASLVTVTAVDTLPNDGNFTRVTSSQFSVSSLAAGESGTARWLYTCVPPPGADPVFCKTGFAQARWTVTFQGVMMDSVPPAWCCGNGVMWPGYTYTDLLGASVIVTL